MRGTDMKFCNTCGYEKEDKEFGNRTCNERVYLRSQCRKCESKKRKRCNTSPGAARKSQEKYLKKISYMRANNIDVDRWILQDSKQSDKRKNLENNLDREFIREKIKDGCVYCGEAENRLTLDRIDNTIGHIKDNVVCACIRCNYIRGSMPYEAWNMLIPGIRKAKEKGYFGDWTGRTR
jgi:hypothetical protein